jgi:hypothetical protein
MAIGIQFTAAIRVLSIVIYAFAIRNEPKLAVAVAVISGGAWWITSSIA